MSAHESVKIIFEATALIVATVALFVAITASIDTHTQSIIMEKEFGVESVPPQIPSFVANDLILENNTYNKQPMSERIAVSIVSPHYSKIDIQSITFNPYGNFTKKPEIVMRPIEKFIGSGVTNLEFNVPFNLTLNINELARYPADTRYVGISMDTTLLITDLQNKTNPVETFHAYNYLGINGNLVPKYILPNDTSTVNEQLGKQINKHIQN